MGIRGRPRVRSNGNAFLAHATYAAPRLQDHVTRLSNGLAAVLGRYALSDTDTCLGSSSSSALASSSICKIGCEPLRWKMASCLTCHSRSNTGAGRGSEPRGSHQDMFTIQSLSWPTLVPANGTVLRRSCRDDPVVTIQEVD